MSLAGLQINPMDVNFCLQNSLEFFDKTSVVKIWSKKDKGVESAPLMPIRVNLALVSCSKVENQERESLQFNAFREMDSFHYTNDELSAFYFLSKLNSYYTNSPCTSFKRIFLL